MFKEFKLLNGAWLKWIAMTSMLFDHIDKGILDSLIIVKGYTPAYLVALSNLLAILGRVAFPIFLFLLVEGFVHTRSRRNYFLYLLGFGILAEVPYDMFECGVFWDPTCQNMYFTLALGLLVLCAIDGVRKRLPKVWVPFALVIALAGAYLAAWLGLDYHYYGILIPVIFYMFRQSRLLGSALSYLLVIKEVWSVLGFAVLLLYNGERGRINKWFCYCFYPLHLFLIGLIRIYVLKC